MTDWTTARVVRDRDGDLWFRGCDSDSMWTANTDYPDAFLTSDEVVGAFGPLVPVLDDDGLPVVRTVGDLTARHIGRRVTSDECDGVLDFIGAERCRFECLLDLDGRPEPRTYGQWLTLDTPCELLP